MKTLLNILAGVSAIALATGSLGTGAQAADLPVKSPPLPVVAPAINWTGWHVGFHAGAGWGDSWWSDYLVLDNVSYTSSGWVTGVQLGWDIQSGPVVVGFEGEWSWTNLEGNGVPPNYPGQFDSKVNWLASGGGRVGLVADKALVYVKVAAVWADQSRTLTPNLGVSQTISDGRLGFLLGAGVEYWIAPLLSAKLEYNYDDFGSRSYTFNTVPGQVAANDRERLHVFKLGLNYRFGQDAIPLPARY
jgi:outer membrane immunogenic protein